MVRHAQGMRSAESCPNTLQEQPCFDQVFSEYHFLKIIMAALLTPVGNGRKIVIDRPVILVGRSPECDAVLDVSSKISRMHCALIQVDASYFIRDLGSLNGVRVNGTRVDRECSLTHGARVAIGDIHFQFLANVPASQLSPPEHQKKPSGSPPSLTPGFNAPAPVSAAADSDIDEIIDVEEVEVISDESDIVECIAEVISEPERRKQSNPVHPVDSIDVIEIVDDIEIIDDDDDILILDDSDFDDPPQRKD